MDTDITALKWYNSSEQPFYTVQGINTPLDPDNLHNYMLAKVKRGLKILSKEKPDGILTEDDIKELQASMERVLKKMSEDYHFFPPFGIHYEAAADESHKLQITIPNVDQIKLVTDAINSIRIHYFTKVYNILNGDT